MLSDKQTVMRDGVECGPDWTLALAEGEAVLWTGRPEHGRRFYQLTGQEPVLYASMVAGIAVMWGSLAVISFDGSFSRGEAVTIYAALTTMLFLFALWVAWERQFVLCNLYYALTDRRAIVCRRGRDWRLRDGLYFIGIPYDPGYAFPILPGRPYASLRVGSALSEDSVQPFGAGLAHSGWPALRGRVLMPILFENISTARELREMLLAAIEARLAGAPRGMGE